MEKLSKYVWLSLRAKRFLGASAASWTYSPARSQPLNPLTRRTIRFRSYPFHTVHSLCIVAAVAYLTVTWRTIISLISTRPLPYTPSTLHVLVGQANTTVACWSLNPESRHIICCLCQVWHTILLDSHPVAAIAFSHHLWCISLGNQAIPFHYPLAKQFHCDSSTTWTSWISIMAATTSAPSSLSRLIYICVLAFANHWLICIRSRWDTC